MQNPLTIWDNVYTITYQVDSYSPFQLEVCLLVGYDTYPAAFWNKKVTRLASGDIYYGEITLHIFK